MVKIAIVGIVAVLLAIQLKSTKSEYGTYISLAACIVIVCLGMSRLESIVEGINKIQSYITINKAYLAILLKIVGITYIAEFASNLCKDAGHGAISNQIELVGKLTILSVSMPILLALLDTVNDFLS
ncbi:stage III sporulation protein AD [Lachnospiraceae bacterium KM106-2]|nr:stage III sporulation protein AD [Lachnospiraceae bacterium KM106-2]